jgi:hypothetical protein
MPGIPGYLGFKGFVGWGRELLLRDGARGNSASTKNPGFVTVLKGLNGLNFKLQTLNLKLFLNFAPNLKSKQ